MIWFDYKGLIYSAHTWDEVRSLVWNHFFPELGLTSPLSLSNLQKDSYMRRNRNLELLNNKIVWCNKLILEIKERCDDHIVREDRLIKRAEITS